VNVMEGDLLDARRDIMQAVVEERAPGIDGHRSRIRANWRFSNCTIRAGDHRNKRAIKTRIVEIEIRIFLEFILPATMALDSANRARAALASSSVARRVA